MRFDELDDRMRTFETTHDLRVLPGVHIVARLDGRSFTRLTKEVHAFEAPFDVRFRDLMAGTAGALMAEFGALYGYTQSDEVSLLFPLGTDLFNRKQRKLNSVLAGFASARFALDLGAAACFDCRICELPSRRDVVDYFRWRSEDACRNALNAHCYWHLRRQGRAADAATRALAGLSIADKNELLFRAGVNFNDLPAWQKRGIGLCWEEYGREGVNPITGERVVARRRRVKREFELPMKDAYDAFISGILGPSQASQVAP